MDQIENLNISSSNDEKNQNEKKIFWNCFRNTFIELTGKPLTNPKYFLENIKPLFYYFLQYDDFFQCAALRKDITNPSFDKGLMIMGGYGLGKTVILRVLEKCFLNDNNKRFKLYTANEIVTLYESCETQSDKDTFFKRMKSGRICIDDFFTERLANNYGKIDILREIIEERYSRGKKTYITCNYADGYEGDVMGTLQVFGERYGNRVYDRFFEMFNIIEFKGKSMRR